jgi:hypothetical protein
MLATHSLPLIQMLLNPAEQHLDDLFARHGVTVVYDRVDNIADFVALLDGVVEYL